MMMANTVDNSWLEKDKTYEKCPSCSKGTLDIRIPRGFFVKYIFTWIGDKRYKCDMCGKKKYVKH